MKESNSRREFLSQSGKMVTAAALFGAVAPVAYAANPVGNTYGSKSTMTINDKHYYLDNVLLEAGFDYENSVVVHTRTALQTVEIQDGKIVALRENKQHPDATLPHYDAGGKLMLPAMRDMHIHLDKTFYGGPWRSLNRPAGTTIQDMIRLEQKLLPDVARRFFLHRNAINFALPEGAKKTDSAQCKNERKECLLMLLLSRITFVESRQADPIFESYITM